MLTHLEIRLLPGAISDLFAQASSTGKITLADRYGLMAALLEDTLTPEERASIDRLLHALRRGRLKVVLEISDKSTADFGQVNSPTHSWDGASN